MFQLLNKKRVALFIRQGNDESTLKRLHDYANLHNYLIVPVQFSDESEILEYDKQSFDAILSTEVILLPIAGIELITI